MTITDYHFENRIFFAREVGMINPDDAQSWAERLTTTASTSELPIVALVDAMNVKAVHYKAEQIFADAAFTDNLLAVVVATNQAVSIQARAIGLLGKRGHTRIFSSLKEARQTAGEIVRDHLTKPE